MANENELYYSTEEKVAASAVASLSRAIVSTAPTCDCTRGRNNDASQLNYSMLPASLTSSVSFSPRATKPTHDATKLKASGVTDGKILTEMAPAPFFLYRDHSQETDSDPFTPLTPPGRVPNFPAKMHSILSNPELNDVVTWLPHGRSWRVLKPREFEIRVLPTYFEHSKFSSFIRQANGWGFRRITQGRDRNSYYHAMFLRGLPHLCKKMRRPGVSEKTVINPDHEPNFYKISEIYPVPENSSDESILLDCTVLGGPKARMPVHYGAFTSPVIPPPITRTISDLSPRPETRNPSSIIDDQRKLETTLHLAEAAPSIPILPQPDNNSTLLQLHPYPVPKKSVEALGLPPQGSCKLQPRSQPKYFPEANLNAHVLHQDNIPCESTIAHSHGPSNRMRSNHANIGQPNVMDVMSLFNQQVNRSDGSTPQRTQPQPNCAQSIHGTNGSTTRHICGHPNSLQNSHGNTSQQPNAANLLSLLNQCSSLQANNTLTSYPSSAPYNGVFHPNQVSGGNVTISNPMSQNSSAAVASHLSAAANHLRSAIDHAYGFNNNGLTSSLSSNSLNVTSHSLETIASLLMHYQPPTK